MNEAHFELRPTEPTMPPILQSIINDQEYVRRALDDIKAFDQTTYKHTIDVATLVSQICDKIGLTKEESLLLIEASLVHDEGKTAIDKEILFKKDKLTNEDWKEIHKHVYGTFQFVKDNGKPEVAKIAVAHHDYGNSKSASRTNTERRQNNLMVELEKRIGTERRTNDEQVKKLSRILAITDCFDGLRSERQYKEGFTLEKCKEILLEKFPTPQDKEIIKTLTELPAD